MADWTSAQIGDEFVCWKVLSIHLRWGTRRWNSNSARKLGKQVRRLEVSNLTKFERRLCSFWLNDELIMVTASQIVESCVVDVWCAGFLIKGIVWTNSQNFQPICCILIITIYIKRDERADKFIALVSLIFKWRLLRRLGVFEGVVGPRVALIALRKKWLVVRAGKL